MPSYHNFAWIDNERMRHIFGSIISQQSIPLNPSLLGAVGVYATEPSPSPASIPLVSIFLPMFSVLIYILNPVESVGRTTQDLFSAAIIAVDNNSPSNSHYIVKEYADKVQKTTTPKELGKGNMAGSIK